MLNWALRETVTKLLFGKPMLPGPGFYAVSYSLLAVIYLIAILVPSGEGLFGVSTPGKRVGDEAGRREGGRRAWGGGTDVSNAAGLSGVDTPPPARCFVQCGLQCL